MKFHFGFFIFFFSTLAFGQVDFGTGAENCDWTTNQTLSNTLYNCDDVYVPSSVVIKFDASSAITIKARGSVTIDGTLNFSADHSGSAPGPGGENGGVNANGSGAGAGLRGDDADNDFNNNGGGGGTGARHAGIISTADGNGKVGSTDAGVAGAATTFPSVNQGSEANFQTTIAGGSGGGAGGIGYESSAGTGSGGNGGNGGGAVRIYALQNITVSATGSILANGGNGSQGSASTAPTILAGGGGGGGGAGGSIYLYSSSGLYLYGIVRVSGGNGGAGGATGQPGLGGAGGLGDTGRIRLDSPTGSYVGNSSVSVFNNAVPSQSVSIVPKFSVTSDIEYNCAVKEELPDFQIFIITFLLGLGLALIPARFKVHR